MFTRQNRRFNRDIVECKDAEVIVPIGVTIVLIET